MFAAAVIGLLHWNPHWQCFGNATCAAGATKALDSYLTSTVRGACEYFATNPTCTIRQIKPLLANAALPPATNHCDATYPTYTPNTLAP